MYPIDDNVGIGAAEGAGAGARSGLTVTEVGAVPAAKGEPATGVRTPVPAAMV